MVLQFGFITIFVAAFPLAPLFALLNNWVEIRLDAQKFVCETRRAVAERAENIGIWFKILEMLAKLAVISNAFLIAFTSDFIQKIVYKYEYGEDGKMDNYVMFTLSKSPEKNWIDSGQPECYYRGFRDEFGMFTPVHWKILALKFAFVIIFEHVVFGVCKLIDILVPDIPASLDIKIKRERYLAKEALQDAEHVLHKVMTDYDSEGHDTDTETNISGNGVFRKQPSGETQYNNPCHTTGSLETNGQEEVRENSREINSSTKLHSIARRPNSPPALRQVVIQASSSLTSWSHDSPVPDHQPHQPHHHHHQPLNITQNKTYRHTEEAGEAGEAGTYNRTISFPPSRPRGVMRSQQSCPEPTRPGSRHLPAITKQRTPPPIPARRRLPPPHQPSI